MTQSIESLPASFNYPTFPKHGVPRIVTTLGLLSIPAVGILLWVLVLVGVGLNSSNSTSITSNYNSKPSVENRPVESSHARGVQAGFEYGIRDKNANARKNLDQSRLKKLAAQISARVNEDRDWQLGFIDGYKKAFASSIAQNSNADTSKRIQTAQQETSSTNWRQTRRPTGNEYIRGPRGGCYYLSASGRKVYVDRGLCN